jgi:hypothetical protein
MLYSNSGNSFPLGVVVLTTILAALTVIQTSSSFSVQQQHVSSSRAMVVSSSSSGSSSSSKLLLLTRTSSSNNRIKLHATIEGETESTSAPSSSLLDENILSRIKEAADESKQWAQDFDLVEESGAAFHALFSGIRSSAALGTKGRPFYLKGEEVRKALGGDDDDDDDSGNDPFNGYFTFDDLAKALEDDFLDANRGTTDNRKGWKVCLKGNGYCVPQHVHSKCVYYYIYI